MALSHARQIRIFTAEHLDPAKAALAFADAAREHIDGMVQRREVPATYRHFVDGREGVPFRSVRPGGTIVAEFTYNAEILVFALAFLYARSPTRVHSRWGKDTREYRIPFRQSFWVGINGKYVRPGALNPAHVPSGPVEFIIGNVQPYNRIVTTQRIGTRDLKFNAPKYLYADCATAINERFGNVVSAEAVWDIHFPEKYKLQRDQLRAGTLQIKRARGDYVESPAVVINPR